MHEESSQPGPAAQAGTRRPSVDVVVPFRGGADELTELLVRLSRLHVRDGDTLTIVDNSPQPAAAEDEFSVRVVRAAEIHTSYYARNRGAAGGRSPWILFIDADVEPPPDLLDAYFDPAPEPGTAVLAGGVRDEDAPADGGATLAERFAALRRPMAQENTMNGGPWSYAQTANCAVRRDAFDAVGGFVAGVRSGGDADLCFRLRAAGHGIEARPRAAIVHRNRTTLRALLRQRARHGAGAAWLNRGHPGAFPPDRSLGNVWWSVRDAATTARAVASGRHDEAVLHGVRILWYWAFELGRFLPNRPR
jgi:GT2 family glycosyltransferase